MTPTPTYVEPRSQVATHSTAEHGDKTPSTATMVITGQMGTMG